MSAIRITCRDEGAQRTMMSILRTAVVEVDGANDEPALEFPGHDPETGRRVRVEARPFGETSIDIEVVAW